MQIFRHYVSHWSVPLKSSVRAPVECAAGVLHFLMKNTLAKTVTSDLRHGIQSSSICQTVESTGKKYRSEKNFSTGLQGQHCSAKNKELSIIR